MTTFTEGGDRWRTASSTPTAQTTTALSDLDPARPADRGALRYAARRGDATARRVLADWQQTTSDPSTEGTR